MSDDWTEVKYKKKDVIHESTTVTTPDKVVFTTKTSVPKIEKVSVEKKTLEHQDFGNLVLRKPSSMIGKKVETVKKVTPGVGMNKNHGTAHTNLSKIEKDDLPTAPKTVPHDIYIQLQKGRTAVKMTQKELATATGISESVIKSIENGTALYDSQTKININKMAVKLGIKLIK